MTTTNHRHGLGLALSITAVNVLVSCGFSLAAVLAPAAVLPPAVAATEAALIFSLYAASRSIALLLVTLWALWRRSAPQLAVLGSVAGLVQLMDAGVGLHAHDCGKALGPLVLAALQCFAVRQFSRASAHQPR